MIPFQIQQELRRKYLQSLQNRKNNPDSDHTGEYFDPTKWLVDENGIPIRDVDGNPIPLVTD